jgi:histone deacetylase 1/2
VINRFPYSVIGFKSPFEMLSNKIPNYHVFKQFGCACFPFLRPYNKYKMDPRSELCIFLGYSTSHKVYKCMISTGKIYIARHVKFDENCFLTKSIEIFFKIETLRQMKLSLCLVYLLFLLCIIHIL